MIDDQFAGNGTVKRDRRPRFYLICIALAITFGFSALSLRRFYAGAFEAQGNNDARLASLQADGKPIDDATLAKFYELNTSADFKAWFDPLMILVPQVRKEGEVLGPWSKTFVRIPVDGAWTKEEETRKFLASIEPKIKHLKTLTKARKRVRFPIKFQSIRTELPNVQQCQKLVELLSLETQVAIRDRDSRKVQEGISAMHGVIIAAEGIPFLVADLVRIRMWGIARAEIQTAIKYDVLKEEDLREILQTIHARTTIADEWRQNILSERASGLGVFEELDKLKSMGLPTTRQQADDMGLYLDFMDDFENVQTSDLGVFLKDVSDVEAKMARILLPNNMAAGVITGRIMPAMSKAAVDIANNESQFRLCEVAIGLRLYKIKHGRFPEKLDLLEDVGFDSRLWTPIGDRTFEYVLEDKNATLKGVDLEQDGALQRPPGIVDFRRESSSKWIWELQ